jgi:hypothetical protein
MSEDDRVSIARLETQVSTWMDTTNEYRVNLCNKIDKIMTKFEDLPCKERGEMYKGMGITAKLMWTAIGVTFGLIAAHMGWK